MKSSVPWTSTKWSNRVSVLILTVLACVIVVIENHVLLGSYDRQNVQQNQSTSANIQQNAQAPNPASSKEGPKQQQSKSEPNWYQNPQWILVIITGAYVVATIVYAVFAGLQWAAIRQQSNVLAQSERPHIVVEKMNIEE